MSQAHQFDKTILREYDIRGIVGKTLNAADAKAVGQSFGTVVKRAGGNHVCVGYDGRHSSPELAAAMVEGLLSTGVNVTRVGLGPTPMLYFSVKHTGADAGVMITGSHNPPEYNGIKMMHKGPVYGEAILELGRMAAAGDFEQGQGTAADLDIKETYVNRLLQDYTGTRDLTVVWDCGNGAAGEVLEMLVKRLPGKHHVLFSDIDGNFPNHHPDPTVEKNLADLKAKVAEVGADLGIGFDGDGDRIGAIDHLGEVVWGDQLLAIYAREVLEDVPGATIIADVKASQTLYDQITKLGGTPLMWKTGHSLIKAKMAETSSPLAGEMSGHIFFAHKYYGYDDALYCGVRLVGLVSKYNESLKALRDVLPKVLNTPEVRFQVDESRKFEVVKEIRARLMSQIDIQVNDLDGVRVTSADGWWLLRASNTQDVLVARAEGYDADCLNRLKAALIDQLEQSGISARDIFD